MPTISFSAQLHNPDINSKSSPATLLTLPREVSAKLPSRGTVMVEGTINDFHFRGAMEPDGKASHWFRIPKKVREVIKVDTGDTVSLKIMPTKLWPEPKLPADLERALATDPQAQVLWMDITPMARWEWIRWVESVKLTETRIERPEKLRSMLKAGKRRPCCFNRAVLSAPKSIELI